MSTFPGGDRTFTGSTQLTGWTTLDYPIAVGDSLLIRGSLLADAYAGGADVTLSTSVGASSNAFVTVMTPSVYVQSVAGKAYPPVPTTGVMPQAISFPPTQPIGVGAASTVTPIGGGSSNPVILNSLTPTICSVHGYVITGLANGRCTIAADQFGDATYAPAPRTTLDIVVGSPAGAWATQAGMPTARAAPAVGVIGGKVYVAGGCCVLHSYPFTRFGVLEVFDPGTNSWGFATSMPTAVESAPSGVIDGKLYVAAGAADQIVAGSGLEAVSPLQVYDPATNTWSMKAAMPFASFGGFAGVIDGKLYVAGGRDAISRVINSVRVYDPLTDTWSSGAPMPSARSEGAATVLNGKLYAIGGYDGTNVVGTVEAYDPATNSWQSLAPIPTPRYSLAAHAVGGVIYAIDGLNGGSAEVSTVEVYNTMANEWSTAPSSSVARHGPGAAVVNGTLYAIGGFVNNVVETNLVEAFTPAQQCCSPGTFSTSGNTPCTPCPAGTYASAAGASSCTLAPPGSYVSAPGSASATPCPPGYFSSGSGSTSCAAAPAGHYASGSGNTSASLCAAGSFSDSAGATFCTLAPFGSFVAGAGATFATQCPVGSYSSVSGAVSCTLAPAGYYVSVVGATKPVACSAGSYSAQTGAAACVLAPAGDYVSAVGSTSAAPCPAGSYSSTPGSTSCTLAPAGTYVSSVGSSAPVPCPTGTWSDAGAISCTPVSVMIAQTITAALGTSGLAASLQQQVNEIVSAPTLSAKAGKLQAFINHVEAQRGKSLTNAQADRLIALAQRL